MPSVAQPLKSKSSGCCFANVFNAIELFQKLFWGLNRYVCFDPLGNWLLTGISNGPRNLSQFSFGTTTSQPAGQPLAPPTPQVPLQVPPQLVAQPSLHTPATVSRVPTAIQGIYRLERTEQERERNLQSRYHV